MAGENHYATASRRKILEILKESKDKTVTVIRYVSGQGAQAAYQYVEQGKGCCDHLHLQCVKCGRIYHLDCAFMKEISEHIEKDHGFELQCRNSVLYGICKDCKTMKA